MGAAIAVALLLPASASAWQTWGNERLNDCAYAAAANWELAALGHAPTEAQLEAEYLEASPADEGVTVDQFKWLWRHVGIGGVRATLRGTGPKDTLWHLDSGRQARQRLAPLLGRAHFLLAETLTDGGHAVLLAGSSAQGVNVVQYGEETTVPWGEWAEEVVSVWTVATTPHPSG